MTSRLAFAWGIGYPHEAMDSKALLKSRLTFVRRDLDEAVARLDGTELDWAPTDGMRTIGGLLYEIVATELQDLALFKGEPADYDSIAKSAKRETLAEYRDLLKSTRQSLISFLDSKTEEDLSELIDLNPKWFEGFGNSQVPLAEAVRSVAMHEWYHTAQLVSYLWIRGDNPYKWD